MTGPGLIITADDFGMSFAVNEAVEEAHRKGVLTCASLVVAGPAAEDAVQRALRMPDLGVGLHLALLDAPPALPDEDIPDLIVAGGGALRSTPAATGLAIAISRRVRDQAREEMRAQFDLFARTGLKLDHVDGHWHFHQHPTLVGMLIHDMARTYGVRAVRVPNEPALQSWRAAGRRGLGRRIMTATAHAPLWSSMRRRLRRAGIGSNDWFFGLNESGAMTRERLLGSIANLPFGVSEIGMHPANARPSGPHALPATYRVTEELQALVDPDVIEACRQARLGRFSDLVGQVRAHA